MPNHPSVFPVTFLDQCMYLSYRFFNLQIHGVIAVEGKVDAERLAKAVRLSLEAEPILGCRLILDAKHPWWKRRTDLDEILLCTVNETLEPEEAIRGFVTREENLIDDPLVRIGVFRSTTDTIVVKMSHMVADGVGMKDYLYLLSDLYQRLSQDPEYRPVPNTLGDRTLRQMMRGAGIIGKLRLMRRAKLVMPSASPFFSRPEHARRIMAVRKIEPEQFGKIKEYAKARHVTVNDMVLSAYYQAMFQVADYDPRLPMSVTVPIDYRPFTKNKRAAAICNLVGNVYPTVVPADCKRFDDTLSQVNRSMAVLKKKGPILGLIGLSDGKAPSFSRVAKVFTQVYDYCENAGKWSHALSNIGIIDENKLHFDHLNVADASILTMVALGPIFAVGFSTFKDRVTLSAGYCRETGRKNMVERFLDLMVQELMQVVV